MDVRSPAPATTSKPQAEPLPSTTIDIILQFIVPPSLLEPLPPHLLSRPLLQRHHFLHLSAENPLEYLVWPGTESSLQQTVIDLLEKLPRPAEQQDYTVRYAADAESCYAHAAIPSGPEPPGLRLIFLWEPDGWKYHNIGVLPFPPDSHPTLQEAMLFQPIDFLEEVGIEADLDEDAYWDSYGGPIAVETGISAPAAKNTSNLSAEDAYWAQYSSVHGTPRITQYSAHSALHELALTLPFTGTADSTSPTPPPLPLKMKEDARNRLTLAMPDQGTSILNNPLVPPSPNDLARRLRDIQMRPESPPLIEDSDSEAGSAFGTASDNSDAGSESTPSPSLYAKSESSMDLEPAPLSIETTMLGEASNAAYHARENVEEDDEADVTLKEAIRNVYKLWRLAKRIESPTYDQGEQFLDVVRQVVAETSYQ